MGGCWYTYSSQHADCLFFPAFTSPPTDFMDITDCSRSLSLQHNVTASETNKGCKPSTPTSKNGWSKTEVVTDDAAYRK